MLVNDFKELYGNRYLYNEKGYINSTTKMEITCPKHGTFEQTPFNHINKKLGCPICKKENQEKKRIKIFIEKANLVHNNFYDYSLVEKQHVGKPNKLITILCPLHGSFKQKSNDHLRGRKCKRCAGNGISKKSIQWLTYLEKTENIKIIHGANEGEYKIPGTRYTADGYCKETNTIYEFHGDFFRGNPKVFPSDYVSKMYTRGDTAGSLYKRTIEKENIIRGMGFNLVTLWEREFDEMGIDVEVDVQSIIRRHKHEIPHDELQKIKLELLDEEFKGYKHKHNFRCLVCGSAYNTTLTQRLRTYNKRGVVGCPNCTSTNKHIIVVSNHLKGIDHRVENNVILFDNNVGLYIQQLKGNQRKQLVNLQQSYKDRGIKLLVLFNDEFVDNKNLVLSKIQHLCLKNNQERVHARKCFVVEINATEKNKFLNSNHLQGKDISQINLGAYYGDILVGVMTFCQPRVIMSGQHQNKGAVELSRFATDINYRIPGIASKLLSHFKRNYSWDEIYSYADKRWSTGNVYEQLGFEETKHNPPAYWYVINGKRKHRWGYRKDALKNNYPNYNPNLTEYQNMLNWGYDRVWDCGTIKYTLENK